MSDIDQDDIILTSITPESTASVAAQVYDDQLRYVTFNPHRRHPNRVTADVDINALMRQYTRDNSQVRQITLALTLAERRGPVPSTFVTIPEVRTIDPRSRRCDSAMIVATPTGMRNIMRNVVFGREGSRPVTGKGRVHVATLSVEERCLIAIAQTRHSRETTYLIYRIDSISPFPLAHPLSGENPAAAESMCVANASLVCIHQQDNLRGAQGWVDPQFEGRTERRRDHANATINRLVDYLTRILRDSRIPGFREYFSTASETNDRYAFFGEQDDVIQTVVAENPDEFLPIVWEKIGALRESLREDGGDDYRFHPLPCGIQFERAPDRDEVDVVFNLPMPGVIQTVTTTIGSLPSNWMEESAFRLKTRDFAGLCEALDARGGSYNQKMFTAV